MSKSQFDKPEFSVAMSLETGCIVMVRSLRSKQEVMGSLTRADSIKFAHGILDWAPEAVQAEPEKPKLTLVN
jgi:hypothetical protein